MSKLADLPWLPPPPEDWSARCRRIDATRPDAAAEFAALAQYRLDANRSLSLARALKRLRDGGDPLAALARFRLAILSAHTADLIADCLPAAAARHGVALDLVTAPYGSVLQTALDPGSLLYRESFDAVLVAVDHRFLGLDAAALDGGESVEQAVGQIETLMAALDQNGGPPAILQTLAAPPGALFGSYDAMVEGTLRARVARFNVEIAALARRCGAYCLDVAALAGAVGTDQWFNPVQFAAYKLPFDARMGPIYAEWLGRLLGAIRGHAAKCLVLDLDNTIWGGVVGDDGLDGIAIGQGSARGEAHLALQRLALDLRARGVFLAVASKNEPDVAREPFRSHPDMLLREEHIAVFQANWSDKATNLEAIAAALNIGVDALVLVDDNPAERAQVRQALPQVRVPELPEDPAWYAWTLAAAGCFEAVAYSAEDAERARMQAQDAPRAALLAGARDLTEYRRSLDMRATIAPFDAGSRQRIVQLINKTNQFNLTTKRYTEAQVAALEARTDVATFQVRLADRFGDLGMIAVVICEPAPDAADTWVIDTWLMSCRVFGREMETATLAAVIRAARARGILRLEGRHRPTAKNAIVADLYATLGFALVEREADGTSRWTLALDGYAEPEVPMRVVTAAA